MNKRNELKLERGVKDQDKARKEDKIIADQSPIMLKGNIPSFKEREEAKR